VIAVAHLSRTREVGARSAAGEGAARGTTLTGVAALRDPRVKGPAACLGPLSVAQIRAARETPDRHSNTSLPTL